MATQALGQATAPAEQAETAIPVPPCEVVRHNGDRAYQCGRDSVARVRLTCSGCGGTGSAFVCAPCLHEIGQGVAWAGCCGTGTHVNVTGWL